MIDKLVPTWGDRAAARAFADKIEPMLNDPDREFVPRPAKRSRAEIERLTAELFERLERGWRD